jgi:cephalosporin hydroxylase
MTFQTEQDLPCGHRIGFGGGLPGEDPLVAHQKDALVITGYEGLLRDYPELHPGSVLELGVCCGGSLALWRALWPQARVAGIDHRLDQIAPWARQHLLGCGKPVELHDLALPPDGGFEEARVRLQALGTFDLIIDDARHGPEAVMPALEILWPSVAAGGLYVIEDWIHEFLQPRDTSWGCLQKLIGNWQVPSVQPGCPSKVTFYRGLIAMEKN